jgi:hypothetical protein
MICKYKIDLETIGFFDYAIINCMPKKSCLKY